MFYLWRLEGNNMRDYLSLIHDYRTARFIYMLQKPSEIYFFIFVSWSLKACSILAGMCLSIIVASNHILINVKLITELEYESVVSMQ